MGPRDGLLYAWRTVLFAENMIKPRTGIYIRLLQTHIAFHKSEDTTAIKSYKMCAMQSSYQW